MDTSLSKRLPLPGRFDSANYRLDAEAENPSNQDFQVSSELGLQRQPHPYSEFAQPQDLKSRSCHFSPHSPPSRPRHAADKPCAQRWFAPSYIPYTESDSKTLSGNPRGSSSRYLTSFSCIS